MNADAGDRRRRDRPGQGPAGARRRRRRRRSSLAPRRLAAPVHAGVEHADPAPAGRGHHLRLRRVHDADEHSRLPGALGGADRGLGPAVHRRPRPADRAAGATRPTRPCSESCRAPSTRTCAGQRPGRPGRPRPGRLRDRRRAGEGPAGARSSRWVCEELPEDRPRHLLGIGEPDDLFAGVEYGRRHLRLRDALAGGPQRRDPVQRRAVQRRRRRQPARLRAAGPGVRLLHLRALHPGLRAPPVPRPTRCCRTRWPPSTTCASSCDLVDRMRAAIADGDVRRASGRSSSAGTTPDGLAADASCRRAAP